MDAQVGKFLRERREALGLSQQLVADLAGCSRLLVYEIENGKTDPRLSKLAAIVDVLGLRMRIEGIDRALS